MPVIPKYCRRNHGFFPFLSHLSGEVEKWQLFGENSPEWELGFRSLTCRTQADRFRRRSVCRGLGLMS